MYVECTTGSMMVQCYSIMYNVQCTMRLHNGTVPMHCIAMFLHIHNGRVCTVYNRTNDATIIHNVTVYCHTDPCKEQRYQSIENLSSGMSILLWLCVIADGDSTHKKKSTFFTRKLSQCIHPYPIWYYKVSLRIANTPLTYFLLS